MQQPPAESGEGLGEKLIEAMIGVAPSESDRQAIVGALALMPLEALARVSQFGTRIEVYDRNQPELPLYAKHLQKPNLAGAYSPTANVIFFDRKNITPLVLLHEFSHALDASVGDVSQRGDWQRACQKSLESRICIRPYATHNSAEYFADNLAAHLIPDEQLPMFISHDLKNGIATSGLSKEQVVQNHRFYSHGRQSKADPQAYAKIALFLETLPNLPSAPPRPALSPQQYRAVKVAQLKELKARERTLA